LRKAPGKTVFEIIVIDDGSTDNSFQAIEDLVADNKVIYKRNGLNMGKGGSVQEGIKLANGNYILIQDADNEYSPTDIPKMLALIGSEKNKVIYGSRYLNERGERSYRKYPGQNYGAWIFAKLFPYYVYFLTKTWISDPLTGYKIYPAKLFESWQPITQGFETDHEITCHLINKDYEIIETPIAYHPRSKKEGKKIKARDALKAIYTFWKFRND
jgi:dolichol-phosphate mannosyltransferase